MGQMLHNGLELNNMDFLTLDPLFDQSQSKFILKDLVKNIIVQEWQQ